MLRILFYVIFLLSYVHFAYAVDKIKIIGLFKNKAVVQLDGKQRLLLAGKTSPEGVTLISADSEEAILEINGVRKTYTIGTHIGNLSHRPGDWQAHVRHGSGAPVFHRGSVFGLSNFVAGASCSSYTCGRMPQPRRRLT